MEKEENSGKKSLKASPTIEITNTKTCKKKKSNERNDGTMGSGESEIEDKKLENKQENMDTQSVKSIKSVATSNASNDNENNSCKVHELLAKAKS